jgi:O-antigen/teichoic acid export membrane protein
MPRTASTWGLAKRLGTNSAAYGIFRLINQAGALVMLPVYWAYLTPEDFGLIAIVGIIAMLVQPMANLGLHSSIERFYYEYDEQSKWAAITKIWAIGVVSALLMIVALDQILVHFYHVFFSKAKYDSVRIAVFTIFFVSLQYVPFVILRVTERIREFGVLMSLGFLSMSAINVVLIVGFGMGVDGYFIGQFVNAVIWGAYWLAWMRRRWVFAWGTVVREELRYSIYQLPITIVESANRVVDKFLLEKYVGLAQFGIYSIADKFGGFFYQVNSALKAAFYPIIYKMVGQGDPGVEKMLPRVSMLYYLMLAYTALIFSLLSESFVRLFARPEFHEAIRYIPVFVLIYFIKSQETVWGRGADIAKRTDVQMYISVPLLLGSIALTYVLVRSHGIYGAIAAMLIASTVRVGILIYVGHRLYRRDFPWIPILSVAVYCGLVYFGAALIELGSLWMDIVTRFMLATVLLAVFFLFYIRLADRQNAHRPAVANMDRSGTPPD